MGLLPVEVGVVGGDPVDQLVQGGAAGIGAYRREIVLEGGKALVAEQFLQPAHHQGAFLVGKIDPETLVNQGPNLAKLPVVDGEIVEHGLATRANA